MMSDQAAIGVFCLICVAIVFAAGYDIGRTYERIKHLKTTHLRGEWVCEDNRIEIRAMQSVEIHDNVVHANEAAE